MAVDILGGDISGMGVDSLFSHFLIPTLLITGLEEPICPVTISHLHSTAIRPYPVPAEIISSGSFITPARVHLADLSQERLPFHRLDSPSPTRVAYPTAHTSADTRPQTPPSR